jgi:hypothetical protein
MADRRAALHALVSCPTGSIGTRGHDSPKSVMGDFPMLIEEPVYYCGFNSPKSYGGNSYFIRHPEGNWLVDSPKFLPQLVRQFDEFGGIANIFLTHRDDVADAERYARHYQARRFIHRAELSSQPTAEAVFDGDEPLELAPGFVAVPTPGHTQGHCALLFNQRFSDFCSRAIIWTSTDTSSGYRPRATTAGILGRGKSSRCSGSLNSISSGYCPATASACACRTTRCEFSWRSSCNE